MLAGLVLILSSLPVELAAGEQQNLTAPTKAITTGTQQGTYTATNVDADDGTSDGTTSTSTPGNEARTAESGSAIVYGTEANTYTATATDNNVRHTVTAADQFAAATTYTPISPAKNLRYGQQSGSYTATNVNSNDGTLDTTLAKGAADDSSPVTKAPSANNVINGGGYTNPADAYASDDVYATTGSNNVESGFYGFGLAIPADATVVSIVLYVEWKVASAGPCVRWRASDDGGASWSSYTTSSSGATTDRTDNWDITSSRAFTVAELNSDNFRVALRTNRCGFSVTTWSIDDIHVVVTYTYNVEHEYAFVVAEPENHWTQIDVSDSSSANAGCVGEIYRPGTTSWVSLSWTFSTTEATHSSSITSSLTQYVNASNEIKVRYRCTQISAPDSVVVDLVTVVVTYTPYVDTRLEYVYEFSTTKRATVTAVTFADRSHRAVGNVNVHAYNYQTASWVSLFTVTQTTETAHSFAPTPAADFIHSSTGKMRVRYSSTTTTEASLPQILVDQLSATVDYTTHSLDLYFQFTSQIDSTTWARIWVNDSVAAADGATAYIYNFNTPAWESLGSAYTATESTHAYSITSNAPHYGDGSNRVRVRFAWTALVDSTALTVDFLRVAVTGNTAPTLPSFTSTDEKSSHDPSVLNDDGVDYTEVSGEVEDVNGESDIAVIEVRLYSSYTSGTTTYSRTVTAGDRAQTLEPSSVDNQVVVWNPTGGDDRLSFKFRHVWQMSDLTNPDFYEFTAAAIDTWPVTVVFSGQKITKTVEAWADMVVNDGVANRVYDKTGTAGTGDWGQWLTTAGGPVASSGSGANLLGRYIKVSNLGTGPGTVTVSWDGTAFQGVTDATWTIPIDGALDFKYATGTATDPSTIGTWTTITDDPDGSFPLTVQGGELGWVWYEVPVPDPTLDQAYAQTFTVA